MFGIESSKECKDYTRQVYHKYFVVQRHELAQVLGMETIHGGRLCPTEKEVAWGCIRNSVGPRRKKRGRQDQKQRGKFRQVFLQVLR